MDETLAPDAQSMEMVPPVEPPPTDYDSVENLAKVLPHSYLTKLGAQCLTEATEDYETCSPWRDITARHLKLYNNQVSDMPVDQENVTVMQLPYTRRAVRMFKAKMFPNLYPLDGDIVQLKVQSPELEDVAHRCTVHMNYQLTNEIVEYIPSHDRGMTQELIAGYIAEVWYFDPVEGRPTNEICLAEDVWFSYKHKTDRPDLADVPRINWRKRMHQHQLEAWADGDYYIGITEPFQHPDGGVTPALYGENSYTEAGTPRSGGDGSPISNLDDQPVREAAQQHSGVYPWSYDGDGERTILEQDRWIKLPGEKRQRPVTICIDAGSGRVLRVAKREKDDPKDLRRFQAETEALAAQHEAAMVSAQQSHAAQVAEFEQQMIAAQEMGLAPPMLEPPVPPMLPEPPPAPAPPRRVPWNRWVKYECDVNPGGALGHGLPHDVAGHNELANKVATRYVSLLTMHLLPTGISSRQSRFARGEVQIKLGKINETALTAEQVNRGAGFQWVQFPPPDPQTYKVIDLADKSAQEVTAFDIAMGAPGMSGETATEAEMRHSSATDNISMVAARYNRARAFSLKNLAYINSLMLPEEGVVIYVETVDEMGQPVQQEVRVTREDYGVILSELEVTFTADPSMESQQIRERRAMKAFQTIMQIATTAIGPTGPTVLPPEDAVMLVRAAAAHVVRSLRLPKSWETKLLSAPPPVPPPMEGDPNGQGPEAAPGEPAPGPEATGGLPQEPIGPMAEEGAGN